MTAPDAEEAPRSFGPSFALVVLSSAFYFGGLGLLSPVLPRYVHNTLHGGGIEVGVVVGAFAVSAALLRSWVGHLGDRHGRRLLVVAGSVTVGLSVFGYGLDGLAVLVLMRLVSGAGEAAVFVGAATTAQDLAPIGRRGQATSFFSIAVYGGLAIGPPIGEWIYHQHGEGPVWVVACLMCLVAAAVGSFLPRWAGASSPAPPSHVRRRFFHRAAVRPGIVLCLGAMGYAGFSSFVPLYADRIGLRGAGPVFVEYAVIVLAVRVIGSRIPDALGPRRGPLVALSLQALGLVAMGTWSTPAGLYASTAMYAAGVSLLYPALFPLVVDSAPPEERSHAIGTFTLFFDAAEGLGALVLGAIVAVTSERGAFIAAGVCSAAGWWLHRSAPRPPPPREASF